MELHGLDTERAVFFYEQDFYVLSNFSAFSLKWQGRHFPTSEHAYHWEKFTPGTRDEHGLFVRDRILEAVSAHEAFKLAEGWKPLRRSDWDSVKVDTADGERDRADMGPGWWPVGTNLLSAAQARAMLEHVLGPVLALTPADGLTDCDMHDEG